MVEHKEAIGKRASIPSWLDLAEKPTHNRVLIEKPKKH